MSNQNFNLNWDSWRALLVFGAIIAWAVFPPAARTQGSSVIVARAANTAGWVDLSQSSTGADSGEAINADPAASVSLTGRDPFKLPPPLLPSSNSKGGVSRPTNLPPGIRGLIVSDLKLEGVVSENSGHEMIAVVTNDTNRAYFLRSNEQLYDGVVTRITPQAAFFTERVRDRHGRETIQTVVKRLNPKPGDGQ